jgi:hypothetical protein
MPSLATAKYAMATQILPAGTAIAVAHQMDAALVVVHRFPIIQPVATIQVFLVLVMHTMIVMGGAAMTSLLVILIFIVQ